MNSMKNCLFLLLGSLVIAVQSRTHSQCYGSLGCFTVDSHLPLPQDPVAIQTRISLYDRQHAHTPSASVTAEHFTTEINSFLSRIGASKETKFIIHGFLDKPTTAWIAKMKDGLLQKGDFNVLVVDWSHGNGPDYNQAVTNTYIVGAEIAYLLNYMQQHYGFNLANVHVIGHSLGAQVAGHAGHRVNKIGRITGLDPADPGFTSSDMNTRLDKTDANFVDIIHTDASKFVGVSGYGSHDAVGHIDFYPNGGEHQPGCEEHVISGVIGSILHGSLNGAKDSVTCSHSRAEDYFTESLNSNCHFYGHKCNSFSDFDSGKCLGCPSGGCPSMGYYAVQTSERGSFFLSTSGTAPFCGQEFLVEIHASHVMDNTYGEIFVTLMGSNGHSEELQFSRTDEYYTHDKSEKRVLATHADIGTIQRVKVKFDKGHRWGHLDNEIQIHSVIVTAADGSSTTKICGHDAHVHDDQTLLLRSQSGC